MDWCQIPRRSETFKGFDWTHSIYQLMLMSGRMKKKLNRMFYTSEALQIILIRHISQLCKLFKVKKILYLIVYAMKYFWTVCYFQTQKRYQINLNFDIFCLKNKSSNRKMHKFFLILFSSSIHPLNFLIRTWGISSSNLQIFPRLIKSCVFVFYFVSWLVFSKYNWLLHALLVGKKEDDEKKVQAIFSMINS